MSDHLLRPWTLRAKSFECLSLKTFSKPDPNSGLTPNGHDPVKPGNCTREYTGFMFFGLVGASTYTFQACAGSARLFNHDL